MNTKKIGFWLVLLTLAMAIMACEFEASTANITNAVMTKDEAGSTQTTVYAPKDAFFCIVSLANAPDDTKVKAVWTAVDVAGVAANTQILENFTQLSGRSNLTHRAVQNGILAHEVLRPKSLRADAPPGAAADRIRAERWDVKEQCRFSAACLPRRKHRRLSGAPGVTRTRDPLLRKQVPHVPPASLRFMSFSVVRVPSKTPGQMP